MALEISYWTGADSDTRHVFGRFISAESVTLSGVSAQSGAAPANASIARVTAGETCRVGSGEDPTVTAATGWYMPANDIIDVTVTPGEKFAAMTV